MLTRFSCHLIFACGAAICVVVPCSAGPAENPAARRMAEFVRVLDAPTDWQELESYGEAAFSPRLMEKAGMDDHVAFLMDVIHLPAGDLELHGIEARGEYKASATIHQPLVDEWIRLSIGVEDTPPYRITGWFIGAADAPGGEDLDAPAEVKELADQVGEYVRGLAQADLFSGVVLIARDGDVLLEEAWGEANKDHGVKNGLGTRFNLASMNKMWTAVLVEKHVRSGEMSWSDSLHQYVGGDIIEPAVAEAVRLEHLASHTAGFGSFLDSPELRRYPGRYKDVAARLELVSGAEPEFAPGTDWSYSNTGFLLLGASLEAATGRSYYEMLETDIFRPAGMEGAGCLSLDRVNRDIAVGYQRRSTPEGTEYRNNLFEHTVRGGPAGGCWATAHDIHAFAHGLLSGRLMEDASRKRLTSAHPELGADTYGFGFSVSETGGRWGHSGGFTGISTNLDVFEESGLIAIVLSNYGRASGRVVQRIRDLEARLGAD